jgi:GT2 family glycosyltransferase
LKLVIQIPAWNKEETLPTALAALPRVVEGFDELEVLVVDNGSSDATAEVARRAGADRVVRMPSLEDLLEREKRRELEAVLEGTPEARDRAPPRQAGGRE